MRLCGVWRAWGEDLKSEIGDLRSARSASTPGDSRDDADFVAVFDRRVEVLQETDVFLVHIHIHEAAHGSGVVEQSFLDAGEAALQVGKGVADSAGFDVDQLFVVGELAKRGG